MKRRSMAQRIDDAITAEWQQWYRAGYESGGPVSQAFQAAKRVVWRFEKALSEPVKVYHATANYGVDGVETIGIYGSVEAAMAGCGEYDREDAVRKGVPSVLVWRTYTDVYGVPKAEGLPGSWVASKPESKIATAMCEGYGVDEWVVEQ